MNSKIYQRNHFCVSFVILKTRADSRADKTSIKVFFFEDRGRYLPSTARSRDAVAQNQVAAHNNNTPDNRFANFLFAIPVLPGLLFGLVKLMGPLRPLLPRKIIDLSPFHTSLFITNLAHQHEFHLPPLLRVRHDGRVRLHGQAYCQLYEREYNEK